MALKAVCILSSRFSYIVIVVAVVAIVAIVVPVNFVYYTSQQFFTADI